MKLRYALLLGSAPMLLVLRGHTQEPPPSVITSDTAEYCDKLRQMVVDRGSRLPEVRRLVNDGRRMCDHGEVRAGIARLRRALILTHHRPPP